MTEPTIRQTVTGDRNIFTGTGDVHIVYELPPAEAEDRRNLLILLNKVSQFWVKGILEQSFHYEALIQLGKESKPEMVERPWESVLELPDRASRTIPPNKKVDEIFDEAGRALLIVGEPGSGKTVTLLELAKELISRVKDDPNQPIPVVFNLSTWTGKQQPILDWLVSELSNKYQIPKRFGRPWLENNRLLLLLDGLDEVTSGSRGDCVIAINEFVEQIGGLRGLVVCSRLQEYLALPVYLKLSGAICLQPLTLDKINGYLVKGGPQLAALHTTLQSDPVLQELAKTPLMLSVMSLAYQGLPVEALTPEETVTITERRKSLFDTYIDRMFKRKGKANPPYPNYQVIDWLSWLALRMIKYNKTIFLIEELQPNWLSTKKESFQYLLTSFLYFMFPLGIILWLSFIFFIKDFNFSMFLLVIFIVVCEMFKQYMASDIRYDSNKLFPAYKRRILKKGSRKLSDNRLCFLIQTVESFEWSFASIKRLELIALILIIILTFSYAIYKWTIDNDIKSSLLVICMGVILEAMLIIETTLKRKPVFKKILPNQGIIMTIKNFILYGILFCLLYILLIYLLITVFPDPQTYSILYQFFVPGIVVVLLNYGAFDVIKHYSLRLILYLNGYAPLHYAQFLDYGAKLIFLRKVGGGYIFIHRSLLEHFAAR